MDPNLKPGVSATEHVLVERDRSIGFMGERARVYSTPSMVNDVEYACLRLIQKYLAEEESSVGMTVSIDHLAPTPIGCEVQVKVTVSAVDGRKVTLDAEVRDAAEVVGSGVHVRYVIDVARQARRIAEKRALIESRA
ncbi:MAG: hotdog domain-containing protein [Gammaproteobacteria bacterium]|nr:hotdog domain-containing protein [Gammaproteobacteria bacterium]MDX2461823.1 hotdog domain-containing protein [Gammaproteobacteria bacterium]